MITLATAECFTLGKIGTTIHKISSNYEEYKNHKYSPILKNKIIVLSSLFLPSTISIENLLNIKLPKSDYNYKFSKAYNEKNDLIVAELMAKGIKNKLNPDIAIGTTAGVGKGGICIITNYNKYLFTTDINGDLINKKNIVLRQKNGINKTIDKVIEILKAEYF